MNDLKSENMHLLSETIQCSIILYVVYIVLLDLRYNTIIYNLILFFFNFPSNMICLNIVLKCLVNKMINNI